jgi:class 3 adenylate cyclase
VRTCPPCGEENSDRARFCQGCAAALVAEAEAPREVRRTITVVFCDVTGSTQLGEKLDPQATRRIMARYFSAMRLTLERDGATVEKFSATP